MYMKNIRVSSSVFLATLIFSVFIPTTTTVFASEREGESALIKVENQDTQSTSKYEEDIYRLFTELSKDEKFKTAYQDVLHQELEEQIYGRGKGTIAAKVAAKALMAAMKAMGKKAFNSFVKKWAPMIAVWFTYDKMMDALDIVYNMSGTIESALTKALVNVGVNKTIAGILARAAIAVLI